MECAGMRESTSCNQANGSTPHRLQEAIKLRNTAAVAAEEGPVAAAQRDIAVGSFRGAVVNLQLAIFQKACQRLPLIQRIAHRGAGRALRQNLRLQFQQILVELAEQPRRYPLAQYQPLLRR